MAKKYYAIYRGHSPGVYDNSTDFMAQQKGYKNPLGKSFKTRTEAEESLEQYNLQHPTINKKTGILSCLPKFKRKRIALPDEYSQFIASLVLHLLIPLVPLFLEYIAIGYLTTKTLTLIAAIYSISIGRSTNNVAQLAMSIFISCVFSACYGFTVFKTNVTVKGEHVYSNMDITSIVVILVIFFTHALERYNKHVVDMVPFLNLKRD